jgi:Tol biopolymer transport system component
MSFCVNRSWGWCWVAVGAFAIGACDGEKSRDENEPPVLMSSTVMTDEDVAVEIRVLAGASDPDGDALSVSEVTATAGHATELLAGGIIKLTPQRDFHGMIAVGYKVSDGANSVSGMTVVVVRPVNDVPVAIEATRTVHRSAPVPFEGRDVDGDALTFEIIAQPAHGALTGTLPDLAYVPQAGFIGEDTLQFRALDGAAASEPAMIRFQVSPDQAPTAASATVTTDEDSALDVGLVAADADGDPLTFTIDTQPEHGALTGTGNALRYTPAENFAGDDKLVFTASDGELSASATITITVRPVNDAPSAAPQTVAATEDTARDITLAGSDVEGEQLAFEVAQAPGHGAVVIAGTTATYTPAANYTGPDSFTFIARDGLANSAPATVEIDVAAVNDAPVAGALSRNVDEDGTVAIALVGTDVDGNPLTFAISAQPEHGELTGEAPNLTYKPAANFSGDDRFLYTVSDGTVTSEVANVAITVRAVNDLPVATAATVETNEDTTVGITLAATDVEGDALTFTVVTAPTGGTLSGGTGANRTFVPALNVNGVRSFTFKACDAAGCGDVATVTINIASVNDAPKAVDDFAATDPETTVAFDILANDSDVEGEALTIDSVEAAHGDAVVIDGKLSYTPDEGFTGIDELTYVVVDASEGEATGHVHLGVGTFPPGAPAEAITIGGSIPSTDIRAPAISADGRFLAFTSSLALVTGDTNGIEDIYLFDRGNKTLRRASVASDGSQSNGFSLRPHLSGDGRYVVFESVANNLVAGDSNAASDVFRHDRKTGTTIRVSVANDGSQANSASVDPEVSEDGNFVVFTSTAFNLIASDANGAADIFVRDIAGGTTSRVSVTSAGGETDQTSSEPAISGDGRFIAFATLASNVVAGDVNGVADIFLRDRILGTTTRVSVTSTGVEANNASTRPSLSRDGRFISFRTSANNLVPGGSTVGQLCVRDVQGLTTTRVGGSSVISARLSGDGRYAAVFDFNGVFFRDRFAAVSSIPSGSINWAWPMISGTGRYVVVLDATNGVRALVMPNPL